MCSDNLMLVAREEKKISVTLMKEFDCAPGGHFQALESAY